MLAELDYYFQIVKSRSPKSHICIVRRIAKILTIKLQKPAKTRKKRHVLARRRTNLKISIKSKIPVDKRGFEMVPSTGIEPVTFPMSRERATAAPTGLKSKIIIQNLAR